jgi:hypothetical protein
LLCHAAVVARPSPKKGTFVVLVPVGVSIIGCVFVDDDDIKLNYKSLRGNGGIAVFWKKTIDNAVKIKSDGGSRIQVITINNVRYDGGM